MAPQTPRVLVAARTMDGRKFDAPSLLSPQVEPAVKETSITIVQGVGGLVLPFKPLTQVLDVEARVELANEGPPPRTQRLPDEIKCRPGILGSKPVEDVGKVDEIIGLRPALQCFGHAGDGPSNFGHTRWDGGFQPRIHNVMREAPL